MDTLLRHTPRALFPRLKIITVEPRFCASWSDALKLIQRAPNLQTVAGLSRIIKLRSLEEKQISTFTGVHCVPFKGIDDTFVKLVRARPRLTELQIYDLKDRVLPPLWSQLLLSLLEYTSCTLQSLSICAAELLNYFGSSRSLMCRLKSLELFLPEEAEVRHFSGCVAALKFHVNLPVLESLRLSFSDHCFHSMNGFPAQDLFGNSVCTLRNVLLQDPPCTYGALLQCISFFPYITSIAFECLACAHLCEGNTDHPYEVCTVFNEIPTLEEIKICLLETERSQFGYSLDALMCGLTAEEVKYLKCRSLNGGLALPRLQYCPVRPSIREAKCK